jgi:hypothetical protein
MTLGDPLNEALTYLRNTVAGSPGFGDKWSVINIETYGDSSLMVLDLDDGTSIALSVERNPRDVFDEESMQAKIKAKR